MFLIISCTVSFEQAANLMESSFSSASSSSSSSSPSPSSLSSEHLTKRFNSLLQTSWQHSCISFEILEDARDGWWALHQSIHTFWALDLEPSFSLRTSRWELKEQEPSKCAKVQVMKFAWPLSYEVWELRFFPEGSLEPPIAPRSVHSTICRSYWQSSFSPSGRINCIVLDLLKFLLILADSRVLEIECFIKMGSKHVGDFTSPWSTVFSHAEDTSETSMTSASGKVGESDQEPPFWRLAHNSLSHIAISLCQSGQWKLPLSFCSCIMIFSVCFPSYPQPADCWKAILRFVWYWCLVDEQCKKSLWWYCCLSWAARRKTAPAYGMPLS